jgi:hypothetical protein
MNALPVGSISNQLFILEQNVIDVFLNFCWLTIQSVHTSSFIIQILFPNPYKIVKMSNNMAIQPLHKE